MSVYIIAEIGVNHYGSIECAKLLMRHAKAAGADAVKFQAFSPDILEGPNLRRDFLYRRQFNSDCFRDLHLYSKMLDIQFGVTPFSASWARQLGNIVDFFKIASRHTPDLDLVGAVADIAGNRPVFLSAGMGGNITPAVDILCRNELTVMHCVSAYPTPVAEANVMAIETLKGLYGLPVGYSCHCPTTIPAIAAVAIGAVAIEKHIALETEGDRDLQSSITPQEFREMVDAIRTIEVCMGNSVIGPRRVEAAAIEISKERESWKKRS